jgi:hypothetical protein
MTDNLHSARSGSQSTYDGLFKQSHAMPCWSHAPTSIGRPCEHASHESKRSLHAALYAKAAVQPHRTSFARDRPLLVQTHLFYARTHTHTRTHISVLNTQPLPSRTDQPWTLYPQRPLCIHRPTPRARRVRARRIDSLHHPCAAAPCPVLVCPRQVYPVLPCSARPTGLPPLAASGVPRAQTTRYPGSEAGDWSRLGRTGSVQPAPL